MNCQAFEDNIPLYLLEDPCLSQDDREEIESHMAMCPACYEAYCETQWVIDLIQKNPERIREICLRKKAEKAVACLDEMAEDSATQERVDSAPVEISGIPSAEESWARLKAKMEQSHKNGRSGARYTRLKRLKQAMAIAAAVLIVLGAAYSLINFCASKGTVELLTDSGSQPLRFDEQIQTGASEWKEVCLGKKHAVMVNHNTHFTVHRLRRGLRKGYQINLAQGELYVQVKHDGNPFLVKTPNAKALITGTKFDIKAGGNKTDLTLVEGSVHFGATASKDNWVAVTTGNFSSVLGNSAPSAPSPTNVDIAVAWTREQLIRGAIAQKNLSIDDAWIGQLIETWEYPDPIDPATLDYILWHEEKRDWFQEQFPWIFTIQRYLKDTHDIDADYMDLLMISGDIWQFHYPQQDDYIIPRFHSDSVERLANHFGLETKAILQAYPQGLLTQMELDIGGQTGVQDDYLAALKQWQAILAAAEEQGNERISQELLSFSFRASCYLANTRTAAYLWTREHPLQVEQVFMRPKRGPSVWRPSLGSENNVKAVTETLYQQAATAEKSYAKALEQMLILSNEECRAQCAWMPSNTKDQLSQLLSPLLNHNIEE